jgi:lysine 6-dehydrogenase
MKIAVLGAGMVGRTIAADLANEHEITSFDLSESNLYLLKKSSNVKCEVSDLQQQSSFNDLLKDFDLVVNAVPGFMGYETLKKIITAGKNVADISFFPEDSFELDALAKQNNVTAITDCGVAPGMSNLILGYENERMTIKSFECMVGGLPKKRIKPFEYKAPFSPVDVIEEYTRPARYVENGFVVTKPALSDAELIDFKHAGTLESFNTDGLRSILFTMKHIPDMKEKTLRYPGHIDIIIALQKAGFFNEGEIEVKGKMIRPIDVTSAILFDQWKAQPGEAEFTLMKIVIKGLHEEKEIIKEYFLYDEMDAAGVPSMSRTTGYACTAFVKLIAEKHFTKTGIFPPELVGNDENRFEKVMEHLRDRKVIYEVSSY